jgi:endonuclease/exonuclease/phosphatase family metal-dependent hydrolase
MAYPAKHPVLIAAALFLLALTAPAARSRPAEVLGVPAAHRSDELTLLTYNVRGMPWPAAYNRGEALRAIGRQLGMMRRLGRQPDVVLIQEGFVGEVADLVRASGYRYWIKGPDRREPGLEPMPTRYPMVGEGWGRFEGSGLHILSDFPAEKLAEIAYGVCAGLDCLANKGAVLAHLDVPGLAGGVDVLNTHLNSRHAAKVPVAHSLEVHHRQIAALDAFIASHHPGATPLLVGGDFNVKHAPERYDYDRAARPFTVVSEFCAQDASRCEGGPFGEAPWLSSQDLQGFSGSGPVRLQPISASTLFGAADTGGRLSDHDAYLVRYRLVRSSPAGPSPPSDESLKRPMPFPARMASGTARLEPGRGTGS